MFKSLTPARLEGLSVAELLDRLQSYDITFTLKGDGIVADDRYSVLTPYVITLIDVRRPEIIEYLRQTHTDRMSDALVCPGCGKAHPSVSGSPIGVCFACWLSTEN